MRLNRWLSLIAFLSLVLLIEWVSHKMTFSSVTDWYLTLKKPTWTPPATVFGPVWTILYLSIGIGGWLVWMKAKPCKAKRLAFCVYGAQLIANVLWSYFFFFLRSPLISLVDIFILITLIGVNIGLFIKLYRPAGLLLVPYFLWSLYAACLNWAIWELNR